MAQNRIMLWNLRCSQLFPFISFLLRLYVHLLKKVDGDVFLTGHLLLAILLLIRAKKNTRLSPKSKSHQKAFRQNSRRLIFYGLQFWPKTSGNQQQQLCYRTWMKIFCENDCSLSIRRWFLAEKSKTIKMWQDGLKEEEQQQQQQKQQQRSRMSLIMVIKLVR